MTGQKLEHLSSDELVMLYKLLTDDNRYGSYAYMSGVLAEALLELFRRQLIIVKGA